MCKFQHISLSTVDLISAKATLSNQEMLNEINKTVECLHEARCEEFTGTDAEQSFFLVCTARMIYLLVSCTVNVLCPTAAVYIGNQVCLIFICKGGPTSSCVEGG